MRGVGVVEQDELARRHPRSEPVESAQPLLQSVGIPWQFDVQDRARRLEVLSLLAPGTYYQYRAGLCLAKRSDSAARLAVEDEQGRPQVLVLQASKDLLGTRFGRR